MPAFIHTPKDEARWEKAKEAANKTRSEADGDVYWGLVNHIYQNMSKDEGLQKAYDDEEDDTHTYFDPSEDQDTEQSYDPEELGEGFHEIDPNEESSDQDADKWLQENDPQHKAGSDYEEYGDDENEDDHIKESQTPIAAASPNTKQELTPEEPKQGGRFRQPSKDEIIAMRQYTRPWEQRARDTQRLQADPGKNPVLSHYGNLIEARNLSHNDRKSAYNKFANSDEYKNADPITQMEMDDKFEKEWKAKNPEHLSTAMQAHAKAHSESKKGYDTHAQNKAEQLEHVLSGGASPEESFSTEEGLQHVGAPREDEGQSGNIVKDRATSFAQSNPEFINQYAKEYASKAKKVKNVDDMSSYDEPSKKDLHRILGEGAKKDPKVEKFFSHYYPLIGMSARRVVSKLGLDPKSSDTDMSMLHEAGMHGLMQSINDYEHDHPSGASFASHAGNKIRGLMHTALRNQDQIPHEVRQAQKKFVASQSTQKPPMQSTVQPSAAAALLKDPRYSKGPDASDRHIRIKTAQATQGIKSPGSTDND